MASRQPKKRAKTVKAASTMTPEERELYRAYLTNWERVGPLLEQIRIQELRSPDYGKDWRSLDSLLELAALRRETRLTSGLVEQQRIFAKGHR